MCSAEVSRKIDYRCGTAPVPGTRRQRLTHPANKSASRHERAPMKIIMRSVTEVAFDIEKNEKGIRAANREVQ